MLLSPLSPFFLVLHAFSSLIPHSTTLRILSVLLSLFGTLTLLLRHSTYLWISQLIIDHPFLSILYPSLPLHLPFSYCFFWILLAFFYANQKLETLTKRGVQSVYSWTRFLCLVVMIHCTSSVSVSLCILSLFLFLAFASGRWRWDHA